MVKQYECVWYNGNDGAYEVLDFNPNGISKKELLKNITVELVKKGFSREDAKRETVYLLDIDGLTRIKGV